MRPDKFLRIVQWYFPDVKFSATLIGDDMGIEYKGKLMVIKAYFLYTKTDYDSSYIYNAMGSIYFKDSTDQRVAWTNFFIDPCNKQSVKNVMITLRKKLDGC